MFLDLTQLMLWLCFGRAAHNKLAGLDKPLRQFLNWYELELLLLIGDTFQAFTPLRIINRTKILLTGSINYSYITLKAESS